jgi:hypothetical protein
MVGKPGLLVGLLFLWAGGTGMAGEPLKGEPSRHEAVMAQWVEAVKGIQTALEGITDDATARAAAPKLKELYTVFFRAQKDLVALGEPPKAVTQELVKQQTIVSAGMEKIQAQIQRLQSAPYFRSVAQAIQAGMTAAKEPEKGASKDQEKAPKGPGTGF